MIRFFGSRAPAIGAGPLGQLASLRVPARIAAAKLSASFFPRPAASLGLMLSLGVGAAAASPEAGLVLAAAEARSVVDAVVGEAA